MMTSFLENSSTNSIITDFQIIYRCDCKLHYDLYAYGLKEESFLLKDLDIFKRIDYGMIVCSKENFLIRDKRIKSICNNFDDLYLYFNKIRKKINRFIAYNKQLEKDIFQNKFDIKQFIILFNEFVKIMSFRRIPEMYFSKLKYGLNDLNNIDMPSYALTLNNAIKALDVNTSIDEIKRFIIEYGYLANFRIERSKFEDFEYVLSIARNNKTTGFKIQPIILKYDINKVKESQQILYDFAWYEEVRHVYQMRTLRNFRLLFEHYNLNIYETTYDDLYNTYLNK